MIREYEELSITAWPALQNMLYDGWLMRFSEGYTKRANSINPIYASNEETISKIKHCEEYYKAHKLDIVFKMTAAVFPDNLDKILEAMDYRIDSPTSVQTLDLVNYKEPANEGITISEVLNDEWLNNFTKFTEVPEKNLLPLTKMLKNIIPKTYFISYKINTDIIACGLGVLQSDKIGIFDIVVDKSFRNKGYGKKVVEGILKLGINNGAKTAYLQVMLNNPPALHLYSKLGFKEIYKYWYRVK